MSRPRHECPDCQMTMRPIRLIDKDYGGHADVSYASGDAQRGLAGFFPVQGKLRAQICPSCGRVIFYGTSDPTLATFDRVECLRCGTEIPSEETQCPSCGWSYEESVD